MANYGIEDLVALRQDWERVFGSSMPMGFEITPDQVPVIKKCIETESQKPLRDYIDSLPEDTTFGSRSRHLSDQRVEDLHIQQLIPEFSIEALHIPILPGAA